jgi:CDP-glucose 4,6-dehydratase
LAVGAGAMEGVGVSSPVDASFWRGRRVLLTGHTGFKGAWCSLWLARMGAEVTGLALEPDTEPSLFAMADVASDVESHIVDLRDWAGVRRAVRDAAPEIVLHLAAQPLVRRSVRKPVETFAANVLGTAHLLDALREGALPGVVLVVTTDKVYENAELGGAFAEDDRLGGSDPYAASKAAAEIVTASMAKTYFQAAGVPVATARGGNVIGGGDYAEDRLVPDIVRAVASGQPLVLRYPDSVRPWQHVLDCLAGYLAYVQALAAGRDLPRALNVGPAPGPGVTVREIAEAMLAALEGTQSWVLDTGLKPDEARLLTLDTSRIRDLLGWEDRLPGRHGLEATASWYRAVAGGADARAITLEQIDRFMRRETPVAAAALGTAHA